jgi:hypothetical protein
MARTLFFSLAILEQVLFRFFILDVHLCQVSANVFRKSYRSTSSRNIFSHSLPQSLTWYMAPGYCTLNLCGMRIALQYIDQRLRKLTNQSMGWPLVLFANYFCGLKISRFLKIEDGQGIETCPCALHEPLKPCSILMKSERGGSSRAI